MDARTEITVELSKAATGIQGFDEIANGGLPQGRTTLLLGGPGTGKTVFALQTLVNGALRGEPGIFLAFEETCEEIRTNAGSFGWNFHELERDGKLYLYDAELPLDAIRSGEFDLRGTLESLGAKAKQMGAKRVVFDSIDVLLQMFESPLVANRELRRLRSWLRDNDLTGIITARIEMVERERELHYPFLLFTADCVVLLSYKLHDRVSLRGIRILKYRGSTFDQNEFPFTIGAEGIEVGSFGLKRMDYPVSNEHVSTGIPRLDTMLKGGYFRGSSILVTGAPGTAKTTLAGAFIQATCRRKERALYILFDEAPSEIVRNLASVNIRLQPFIEAGLLQLHALQTEARSADEHLIRIKALIEGYQPRSLVIDPLSAMTRAGGLVAGQAVAHRLMGLAKSLGVTFLATSLLEAEPAMEASEIRISTVADTWIHLSYLVTAGERNRALTIVKARGIGHSNQVRELLMSDEGITLTEVYTARGEVLMGALRAEREIAERAEQQRLRAEAARKERELRAAEAEMQARLHALEAEMAAKSEAVRRDLEAERTRLQRELEVKRIELERLQSEEAIRREIETQRMATTREIRFGDVEAPPAKR